MITIRQITTNDEADYSFVENLMHTAFPREERRDTAQQRAYSDNHPLFRSNVITDGEKRIGMVSYWEMGDFIYIEHLAIDPDLRNGGYGSQVLTALKVHLPLPIVLEVEQPTDEMSTRRIGFYQRQGFTLHKYLYMQPPYRPGDSEFPMLLMTSGEINMQQQFDRVKRIIYREVYGRLDKAE